MLAVGGRILHARYPALLIKNEAGKRRAVDKLCAGFYRVIVEAQNIAVLAHSEDKIMGRLGIVSVGGKIAAAVKLKGIIIVPFFGNRIAELFHLAFCHMENIIISRNIFALLLFKHKHLEAALRHFVSEPASGC